MWIRVENSQSGPLEEIVIYNAKKKHLPVVLLQFVRRVGV